MATVASILNGARYDLRNYSDISYDETLMIHYLNRALKILDYTLFQHNSDWTLNRDTVELSEEDTSISVPTGARVIREIWIGTDRKDQISPMDMYYKRQFHTNDYAEPNYWSHVGDSILFEVNAYTDYTVVVFYDKAATAFTASSDTTPYEGRFDEHLREALVMMCQAKKQKGVSQGDSLYYQMFDSIVKQDIIQHKWKRKNYKLDF